MLQRTALGAVAKIQTQALAAVGRAANAQRFNSSEGGAGPENAAPAPVGGNSAAKHTVADWPLDERSPAGNGEGSSMSSSSQAGYDSSMAAASIPRDPSSAAAAAATAAAAAAQAASAAATAAQAVAHVAGGATQLDACSANAAADIAAKAADDADSSALRALQAVSDVMGAEHHRRGAGSGAMHTATNGSPAGGGEYRSSHDMDQRAAGGGAGAGAGAAAMSRPAASDGGDNSRDAPGVKGPVGMPLPERQFMTKDKPVAPGDVRSADATAARVDTDSLDENDPAYLASS